MATKLSLLGREFVDLLRSAVFTAAERKQIVFYSTQAGYYLHYHGIIGELTQRYGHDLTYVTSDPDDPLLRKPNSGLTVLYIATLVPALMRLLEAKVLVTTVPDLGKLNVPRPGRKTHLVYLFHAVVSTHMMYRLGAFDHYDTIFCTGPHHKLELCRRSEVYGVPQQILLDVGHPKIDCLAESFQSYVKQHGGATTVLLAPGWGDSNILGEPGAEIISRLLTAGYRVIVRPHPELRRRVPHLLQRLAAQFRADPLFTLDRDINHGESLLEADIMISDWSGVAFEYAFATERPVISIDLPRKVRNPEWERLAITPFEEFGRQALGPVLSVDEIAQLDQRVGQALNLREGYRASIRELRSRYLFNFGRSSAVGASYIHHLLD